MSGMREIRSRLGDNVKALRQSRGWTQEQLGERAGISYKFIGEIERGVGNPSVDYLDRLSQALEVDITDLFGSPAKGEFRLTRADVSRVREALETFGELLPPPPGRRKRPRR